MVLDTWDWDLEVELGMYLLPFLHAMLEQKNNEEEEKFLDRECKESIDHNQLSYSVGRYMVAN